MTATQTQEFDFSLPELPDHFIGREKELAEILTALKEGKNILISGPKGVGKKSLAIKVARIYDEETSKISWQRFSDERPFFSTFEQILENEVAFFNFVETEIQNKKVSIFVLASQITNLGILHGEVVIYEGVSQKKFTEDKQKTIFSKFVNKAVKNTIPLIITTPLKPLVDHSFLEKYNFYWIDLQRISFKEAAEIIASFKLNLKKEEVITLYRISKGNLESLINLCKFLISMKNLEGNISSYLELSSRNSKIIREKLKTVKFKELDIPSDNNEFIQQLLEHPNDLIRILLEIYLDEITNKVGRDFYLNIFFLLGKEYFTNGNINKALSIFFRVKKYAKAGKSLKTLAPTLLYLGHIYKKFDSLYRARLAYKDALRMFQQLGDKPNIAEASVSLAALEILQGRTTDGRKHLSDARQYFEAQGKSKAVQRIDDLFEAADYVDGAQMVQGRSDGVLV